MVYWFFIVINIIYILFEFTFNFSLLNIVGSNKTTIDEINQIEDIGRFLAASGFTLLLWKYIQAKNINRKWNKSFFVGIFITVISFYGFYISQEKIIDYTARNLSEQTAKSIYNLYLLKEGLISGTVVLQNIPYNEDNAHSAESKTFLITLPLFMISNQKTLNYIEKNKEQISTHIYKYKITSSPRSYEYIYKEPISKLDSFYNSYKKTTDNRNKDINKGTKIANDTFQKMQSELKKKYRYSRSKLTYQNYIRTSEIKSLIKNKIYSKYRLNITRDFDPNSKQSYSNAITGSISDGYQSEFNSKMNSSEYAVNVPLGIKTRNEFYNHPNIVKLLKEKQGDFYIPFKGMGLDIFRYNEPSNQKLIIDNSSRIAKAISKQYVNVNLKSENVIQIIKSMIVPPIALILSIFFGFMNLFLILKILSAKIFSYFTKYYNNMSLIFMYSSITALLILPLVLNNSYTEKKSYKSIYENMYDYNFFIAFSANWILKFEPFVYNNGLKITEKIKIKDLIID